ncbi:unnamed protein product [Durusdinium trenchii]|uniref:Uncharacterized protein n=2 Tax=Durusdinium trenchii TaxID=1381693 RepID=A0ABP0KF15_9DINO
MAPPEEQVKELLREAKQLISQLKAEDAAAPAKQALELSRDASDQVSTAEALRLLLLAQMERGDIKPEEALKQVKDEASKLKRSARDGRRAEAMMQFTQAAIHLAKVEPVKAVQLGAEAEAFFQREQDWPTLAEVLEVVAPAHLHRGDGKKAMDAANLILDVAQKMKAPEVEARAWTFVAAGRFMSKSEDAAEAARKALDLCRSGRHRAGEVQTLLELAKGQLTLQDSLSALASAREALKVARDAEIWPQAGRAVEAIVEAQLQAGNPQAALDEAQEQLSSLTPAASKAAAAMMSAVVVATAALKGADAGLERVKGYVEKLRADGNKRGEVQMLHKLATMSPYADYALNTAQAALKMAQHLGFALEEKALKRTLTELYVAKGKIDKAPNRREALLLLQDLARNLEKKDGDGFDDANQNLNGYWPALTQSDVDAAMQKVITMNPPVYLEFLKSHGANVDGKDAPTPAPADIQGLGLQNKLKTGPKPYLYVNFRVGGISYGPRYRCCDLPCAVVDQPGSAVGVLNLQDISDDWERELQYNPSILDCALQNGAAGIFTQLPPGA